MSIEALNWAFKLQLKSGPNFVLVALANYADENGECYPTYKKIHEMTGISERSIGEHLVYLESIGLVERKRQRYDDGNLGGYRFTLHTRNPLVIEPHAKSRKTTREIPQNHTRISRDNNHQTILKDNLKGVFDDLWKDINPKLPTSRQKNKRRASQQFDRLAKEFGSERLVAAVRAYYADEQQSKNSFQFAAAFTSMFSDRKFEGYLDLAGKADGPSAYEIYQKQKETV